MLTSSGIAFMPTAVYPVYSVTKAGMHHLACVLRQQLDDTKVHVVELVPPYVATELDQEHREVAGGMVPMPLNEYRDRVFEILYSGGDQKEVAVGMSDGLVKAWRGALGDIIDPAQ